MAYPYHGRQIPYDPRWPPQPSYVAQPYAQPYPPYRPPYSQAVPLPSYQPPQQYHGPPLYATPPRHSIARPDRGRDYLSSLTTSVSNLNLQAGPSRIVDKPLPRLPPPPLPDRPTSLPVYASRPPPAAPPPAQRPVTTTALAHPVPSSPARISTPPRKSFTPSFHPHSSSSQVDLLRPPDLTRPHSDPQIPSPTKNRKGKGKAEEVLDLTLDSSSDEVSQTSPPKGKKSPRRRRAISELPRTPASKVKSPFKASPSPSSSNAVRCSGYTRAGQPCKRLVKSTAPYLLSRDPNLGDGEGEKEERYCKDHAGMICQVGGFYWKGAGRSEWIEFADYIPIELGQQTQTLLRTTMESRLTDKELPGFLYAYELRDWQTPHASFFKVGRTDNVPRRMSEWTSQCQSHTPTLRDIFPRRPPRPAHTHSVLEVDLRRRQTGSYLPGAFHSGSNNDATRPRVGAMKRWEKLVHLELADLSSRDCPVEWAKVRQKCTDCGTVHKEIFAVSRKGKHGDEYDVVVEVVGRWAAFVNKICPNG